MKKRKAMALAAACMMAVVSIAGCAGSSTGETAGESSAERSTLGEASSENAASSEEQTPEKSSEESSEESSSESTVPDGMHASANGIMTSDDGSVRENLTALEVANRMGNGINLGNTMEAYGRSTFGTDAAYVESYETFWGQPQTTQEMITAMHDAGFDSLRIPIAWTNMMDYETGDYTIAEAYLDRIEEIINYARNAGMYVIINDHWDGGWWGRFGSATEEIRESAMEMYVSLWTQIAERYKEYSDYLIFESANEELGDRLNDRDVCPDSGTLSKDECYEMTNQINQTFVDTVRGTGGNNAQRFLLIAGYNTDIQATCDSRYQMPEDSAKDKLLVSVHYYTPSGYCIESGISKWGTVRNYTDQNELFAMMTKFTEQGYGVIIGEYAVAFNEDNSLKENTADFIANLLNNCDRYGYCPMLWDCSGFFVRREEKFREDAPDVAKLYAESSVSARADMTQEEIAAAAEKKLEDALEAAPETLEEGGLVADENTAVAWIMFNSGDYSISYAVGDTYDSSSRTAGLVANDVVVTGEGTYTVSLDFTGTGGGYASGIAFSALGIANGAVLYPGYVVDIKEVLINGEAYTLTGKPYTTSDDGKCTRVNLYNGWVSEAPENALTPDGDPTGASAQIIDPADADHMETLTITFTYAPAR